MDQQDMKCVITDRIGRCELARPTVVMVDPETHAEILAYISANPLPERRSDEAVRAAGAPLANRPVPVDADAVSMDRDDPIWSTPGNSFTAGPQDGVSDETSITAPVSHPLHRGPREGGV